MFSQLPIAKKIALLAAILTLFTGLTITLVNQQQAQQANVQLAKQIGHTLVRQLSSNAINAVITSNKLALQTLLQQLLNTPVISYAAIFDATDTIIVESGIRPATGSQLIFSTDITVDDNIVGLAKIAIDSSIHSQSRRTLVSLIVVFILTLLSFYLSQLLLKPISRRLTLITQRINGINSSSTHYSWQDELGELEQATRYLLPKQYIETISSMPARAVMVVHVANLNQNSSTEAVIEISEAIKSIVSLYGGEFHALSDTTTIIFDQSADSGFKALCAGILVREVLMALSDRYQDLKSVAVGIDCESDEQNSDRDTQWEQHIQYARELAINNNGVSLSRLLFSHSTVSEKISISDATEGYKLKSVKKELKELLEQQLGQLLPAEHEQ